LFSKPHKPHSVCTDKRTNESNYIMPQLLFGGIKIKFKHARFKKCFHEPHLKLAIVVYHTEVWPISLWIIKHNPMKYSCIIQTLSNCPIGKLPLFYTLVFEHVLADSNFSTNCKGSVRALWSEPTLIASVRKNEGVFIMLVVLLLNQSLWRGIHWNRLEETISMRTTPYGLVDNFLLKIVLLTHSLLIFGTNRPVVL